jgi:hypothetical protein
MICLAFREFIILCVARKGIQSCVLFRGIVRNGIPRFGIYCILVPRNGIPSYVLFRRRGSEQNNGILLLVLFYGAEFRVVFSSAEGFGTDYLSPCYCNLCKKYRLKKNLYHVRVCTFTPLPPAHLVCEGVGRGEGAGGQRISRHAVGSHSTELR